MSVCAEMRRREVVHEHRSLRFRVEDGRGRTGKYEPAIVARRGSILFLIEPMPSLRRDAMERLSRFLEQHSPEIVLVVVTPDAIEPRIPTDAYDEIYTASELDTLATRIREQNPEGIVRPFLKRRPADGERARDTAK